MTRRGGRSPRRASNNCGNFARKLCSYVGSRAFYWERSVYGAGDASRVRSSGPQYEFGRSPGPAHAPLTCTYTRARLGLQHLSKDHRAVRRGWSRCAMVTGFDELRAEDIGFDFLLIYTRPLFVLFFCFRSFASLFRLVVKRQPVFREEERNMGAAGRWSICATFRTKGPDLIFWNFSGSHLSAQFYFGRIRQGLQNSSFLSIVLKPPVRPR